MAARLFDHLDFRVASLAVVEPFYALLLPALGFPVRGASPHCVYFEAASGHPKPEFFSLIEDPAHRPSATRLAFWQETRAGVDAIGTLLRQAGARNIEGPEFCPEYSPTYYAVFFEDPCGNRLEVCCRTATA